MKTLKTPLFLSGLLIFAFCLPTFGQGSSGFTYQGQLRDGGTNASGAYTMTFKLYDAVSGGNQIGSDIMTTPALVNGLFTVNLDFGAGAFNGNPRWLDITAQSGTNASETLSPRVEVLPSPYAQFAAVAATVTNGAIMNSQLAGNAVNATNIQNNTITTTQLASGAVTNRNLTANAVTTINLQDSAVTDAKIVSVSGSKVSGTVASASSLINGVWNVGVTNVAGDSIFLIAQNNALGLALHSNGQVARIGNGIGIGQNGGEITSDGNGGLVVDDGSSALSVDNISIMGGNGNAGAITGNGDSIEFTPGFLNITGDINTTGDEIINGNDTINGDIHAFNVTASFITAVSDVNADGIFANTVNASNVNASVFNQTSDRNLKENFTVVNPRNVLAKIVTLPISQWNFKTDLQTRHLGPMAQDFYAAFNVGTDDKHIATVDEGGVALAAIQGLNQKLDEKDAEIQKLQSQNNSLEKRLGDLEELLKPSSHK